MSPTNRAMVSEAFPAGFLLGSSSGDVLARGMLRVAASSFKAP
ncbi:hypothetical protein [Archangium lansingense]|uniref:Uncharacterized protein n=1 Tax=Archangium lansingense TaxID=2995310 RepID=A0ABT4ALD3_9BACT|nr:hypothetical protein [Archangium lansinium]MCY1082513.1 hypothetical protein [Archangium lansinium]